MTRPRMDNYPADDPTTLNALIAAQVRVQRKRKHWSQARLAQALGVKLNVAQQIETGSRRISAEELCLLAYTLDVSPAELLSGAFTSQRRVPLLPGRSFSRRAVRAWAAGEPGAALPGMDERRYEEEVSDDEYLARKRVYGLENLEATVHELHKRAESGNEEAIDDCLRALEAQAKHMRHVFGRKRGTVPSRRRASGAVEVTKGKQ